MNPLRLRAGRNVIASIDIIQKPKRIPDPVFLAIAIDTSPSMNGYPLYHSIDLAKRLASHLSGRDTLYIQGFCRKPYTIHDAEDKPARLEARLAKIKTCDGTNLQDSLKDLADHSEQHKNNYRIAVVITDGGINIGRKQKTLEEAVKTSTYYDRIIFYLVGKSPKMGIIDRISKASKNIRMYKARYNRDLNLAYILLSSGIYKKIPWEIWIGHPFWVSIESTPSDPIQLRGWTKIKISTNILDNIYKYHITIKSINHREKIDHNLVFPFIIKYLTYRDNMLKIYDLKGIIEPHDNIP